MLFKTTLLHGGDTLKIKKTLTTIRVAASLDIRITRAYRNPNKPLMSVKYTKFNNKH